MADHPERINFHFVKSADYRVIHVDGAHGGITPHGFVQMTLYAERQPIPQRTTHEVSSGQVGDELTDERLGRDGPVRECEVTAILSLPTATALRDWLEKRIEQLNAARTDSGV